MQAIFAIQEGRLLGGWALLGAALVRIRETVDGLTEAELLAELAVLEKLDGNLGESASRADEASLIYRGMGTGRRRRGWRGGSPDPLPEPADGCYATISLLAVLTGSSPASECAWRARSASSGYRRRKISKSSGSKDP